MTTHLAVITGTSRGIGEGIAAAASSADGVELAVCNRSATGVERELLVDLSDLANWPRFATWLRDLVDELAPQRLTVVHNAAVLSPIGFAGEVDSAAYTANVLLNSAAPQVLGDAVVQVAAETATPTVLVQLSSGAGKNPYQGWSSYCAAKAAVDMWVRSVGAEQADRDDLVRVVAVSPGVVDTGMQAEIRSADADGFPNVERFRDLHGDGHLADPGAVGAAIWALAQRTDWANGSVTDIR